MKKSVSKRRGGRRHQLKEINNIDDTDFTPAKKRNNPHRNKIVQSH